MNEHQEGISILKWMDDNICQQCAFYRTHLCKPQVSHDYQQKKEEFPKSSVSDFYSITCFTLQVLVKIGEDNGKL